jgi:hypothetical protein
MINITISIKLGKERKETYLKVVNFLIMLIDDQLVSI